MSVRAKSATFCYRSKGWRSSNSCHSSILRTSTWTSGCSYLMATACRFTSDKSISNLSFQILHHRRCSSLTLSSLCAIGWRLESSYWMRRILQRRHTVFTRSWARSSCKARVERRLWDRTLLSSDKRLLPVRRSSRTTKLDLNEKPSGMHSSCNSCWRALIWSGLRSIVRVLRPWSKKTFWRNLATMCDSWTSTFSPIKRH